jgi:hypothetical protein
MQKLLMVGLTATALALAGCTAVTEPPVSQATTSAPQSSASSADYTFLSMLQVADIPSYFLEGDLLYALQEQAIITCGYIDGGMTSDSIILALAIAFEDSGADQDVKDAMLAATVASTYSYCPQYENFWD